MSASADLIFKKPEEMTSKKSNEAKSEKVKSLQEAMSKLTEEQDKHTDDIAFWKQMIELRALLLEEEYKNEKAFSNTNSQLMVPAFSKERSEMIERAYTDAVEGCQSALELLAMGEIELAKDSVDIVMNAFETTIQRPNSVA